MSQIPVDQAPAGAETDVVVAWTRGWDNFTKTSKGWLVGSNPETNLPCDVPRYSTDIRAAWDLIEEMVREHSITINWLHFWGERNWKISFTKEKKMGDWVTTEADAAGIALAITRAYLKSKGVETVEVPD